MCTVTFIPVGQKVYISSNRDESAERKLALPPQLYTTKHTQLLYPKDANASGSWIAANANGNAAVLLNGGFEKHIAKPPYRLSRGIVFLEIIAHHQPLDCFNHIDLTDIEPFTLILFLNGKLHECRWAAGSKYVKRLATALPHIWSSATLYTPEIIAKRESWFAEWIQKHPEPTQQDIFLFHQFGGDGDTTNDIQMNRNNAMLTVSITGLEITDAQTNMCYLDLKDNSSHAFSLLLHKALFA